MTALEPGVTKPLAEAVRDSGIKDALAQPIIDRLVKMGQELRRADPGKSALAPDKVQAILLEELKKAGPGCINPLLSADGKYTSHVVNAQLGSVDSGLCMPHTGVDIHQDTPTEILHTILLGVVKYFWGQTVFLLDKNKKFSEFQARLNSVTQDGLNIPKINADYMCKYRGGLIGKHFKTISQIMAFAVHDLVEPEVVTAWLIIGRLTVLLWHTEIKNSEEYLVC